MAKEKTATNVVFVGIKPVMNYVMAVVTQLGSSGEVTLKARGRAISRAVDAAEIARKRFLLDVKVKGIRIGTEELTTKEGGKSNVSTIDIILSK
jgi:DNA-binding protein Alba